MSKTALKTYRSSQAGRIEDTTDYGTAEKIIFSLLTVPSDWKPSSPSWQANLDHMKAFAVEDLAKKGYEFTGKPFVLTKAGKRRVFQDGMAVIGPFPAYNESKSDSKGMIANQIEYEFYIDEETGMHGARPKKQEFVQYRFGAVYRYQAFKQQALLIPGMRAPRGIAIPKGWFIDPFDNRLYRTDEPKIPLIQGIGA